MNLSWPGKCQHQEGSGSTEGRANRVPHNASVRFGADKGSNLCGIAGIKPSPLHLLVLYKRDKMAIRTNPQVDRYQLVKLRSNIRSYILDKSKPDAPYAAYGYLLAKDQIPLKSDGELLGIEGFIAQWYKVKKDINHKFSDFSICFLHRCFINSSSDNMIRKGRNGLRLIMWMTGLQEVTIKDILILNGEMR